MKKIYILSISCLFFLLVTSACNKQINPIDKEVSNISEGVNMGIEATVKLVEDSQGKRFLFILYNHNETVETLTFPTSQQYDYVIKDKDNKIIKQLSKETYYLQVITTVEINSNEEKVYEIFFDRIVRGLEKGTYSIEFNSVASTIDLRAKMFFEVE